MNFDYLHTFQRSTDPEIRQAADYAIRKYAVLARFNWANLREKPKTREYSSANE